MEKKTKPIKPAQFAESEIVKAIISNQWTAGHKLPPERELAELIGVTRPTLREVLQRLSRDGWLTISHGRPTIVNDYKRNGGLGVFKTIVNYDEFSPINIIRDWLEFRVLILPSLAQKAVTINPKQIISKLKEAPSVDSESVIFAAFDWEIQMLLVMLSNNSIAKMLYNDLTNIYKKQGSIYFENHSTKEKSLRYYEKLKVNIIENKNISLIVKDSMSESLDIWLKNYSIINNN
ncbi:MAG: fatty acid metabolism transcriptional regulator FadR [Bacteroidetes bacterium]|nr:MAG: fatty acid metabolism transcriptional regulator FadR [Bacteroidota bacterium]